MSKPIVGGGLGPHRRPSGSPTYKRTRARSSASGRERQRCVPRDNCRVLGSAGEVAFDGVLLLDVDGVLTDGNARPDRVTIQRLGTFIGAGVRLALVTGRSRHWLEAEIIPTLAAATPETVRDFWCAAEYGGICGSGLPPRDWKVDSRYRLGEGVRAALLAQSE